MAQFARGLAANVVFNGIHDLTQVGPMGKVFRPNRVGGFMSRMVGSTSYTVSDNLLKGDFDDASFPTWDEMISKLIIHGSRTAKAPSPSTP
ncbi:hypothetical protein Misp01_01570 [Microtetraspora sp. NBRC 13810]|uniref:hypothetical protein n=1 Tax=Microtetraspora sp. NBRC 13810 TaxID=3030990 RepID=UPI0024A08E52|nr:hypothetical protein [Microtetraspora sp. NBRC 13810]GLW05027.1 hypothetical protein Misp01_01570 [Microtetraspora sp. NBRC 13810]